MPGGVRSHNTNEEDVHAATRILAMNDALLIWFYVFASEFRTKLSAAHASSSKFQFRYCWMIYIIYVGEESHWRGSGRRHINDPDQKFTKYIKYNQMTSIAPLSWCQRHRSMIALSNIAIKIPNPLEKPFEIR